MANYLPWYKRIWPAIKYVFGHKSIYGDWDTISLKDKDLIRLRKYIVEALKRRNID